MGGGDFWGPVGDYAMVMAVPKTIRWYWNTDPNRTATPPGTDQSPGWGPEEQFGPFRVAVNNHNATDVNAQKSWEVRDTMAWLADGTSNQFLVGEKYLHPNRLGLCSNVDSTIVNAGDCTYLSIGEHRTGGVRVLVTRTTNLPLALPNEYPDENTFNGLAQFGSWHPGVCQFLLGDGSVRSVSVTASPGNVLRPYALVNDGIPVQLP
jgi:hypothetical protein